MSAKGEETRGWAPYVWFNGEVVPARHASVSVFDRGFLLGDGVYETLRARAGRIFRWLRHRERLERSLAAAAIAPTWPLSILEDAIHRCLEANTLKEARIRLTVSRGEGHPGLDIHGEEGPPTVAVAASLWKPLSAERYQEGVSAIVPRIRQTGRENLDPTLKSISRIHLVLARLEASQRGAHEAILLGSGDEVTEGTSSNVFLVRQGKLFTPPLQAGILEGVTREAVLETARAQRIPCDETRLTQGDLEAADEIFLTNTSWGALPVTRLDGKAVGSGRVGPVAADLGKGLMDLVERECAG